MRPSGRKTGRRFARLRRPNAALISACLHHQKHATALLYTGEGPLVWARHALPALPAPAYPLRRSWAVRERTAPAAPRFSPLSACGEGPGVRLLPAPFVGRVRERTAPSPRAFLPSPRAERGHLRRTQFPPLRSAAQRSGGGQGADRGRFLSRPAAGRDPPTPPPPRAAEGPGVRGGRHTPNH